MTPNEALAIVRNEFPFPSHMQPDSEPYITTANLVSSHLAVGATILDFGCGPMDRTAVLQLVGYRCTGVDDLQDNWHTTGDHRQRIVDFAARFGIEFRMGDTGVISHGDSFDLIMLTDVIEHFHDSPRHVLTKLLTALRPDGYLLITVPNAVNIRKRVAVLLGHTNLPNFQLYYWYPNHWRGHVREYTLDDLHQLCMNLGLVEVELRASHFMLHRLPKLLRPMFRAATVLAPGWRDSLVLLAQKPKGWQAKSELAPADLSQLMARLEGY